MKNLISMLVITKNSAETLEACLDSSQKLIDEVIIVDDGSKDGTLKIGKKFNCKIFTHHEDNLGNKRQFGLEKCCGEWVLMLDSDEVISNELRAELKKVLISKERKFDGYLIPFQNHFLGKPIERGGEDYKLLRLVRRKTAFIKPALIHEKLKIRSYKISTLQGKIYHYSYRSLRQMIVKFTDYAIRTARQKAENGETSDLNKILVYPVHMFWARFVEDRGYKDGFFRLPLDFGFAYMEFLSYFLLMFLKKKL